MYTVYSDFGWYLPGILTSGVTQYLLIIYVTVYSVFSDVSWYLPRILASGVTPSLLAAVAVISTRAQAPSFNVLALAAVMDPV